MTLSIGVALTCKKEWLPYLKRCLDSIQEQTYLPDKVFVSCSGIEKEDLPELLYSFPFYIDCSSELLNIGQHRNRASYVLDTDTISFFDAKDIMHPQRLQLILHCFEATSECGLVLHETAMTELMTDPWNTIEQLPIRRWHLKEDIPITGKLGKVHSIKGYEHHCTVRRDVFLNIQFSEDPVHILNRIPHMWECSFSKQIIESGMYSDAYTKTVLSRCSTRMSEGMDGCSSSDYSDDSST